MREPHLSHTSRCSVLVLPLSLGKSVPMSSPQLTPGLSRVAPPAWLNFSHLAPTEAELPHTDLVYEARIPAASDAYSNRGASDIDNASPSCWDSRQALQAD